MPLRQDLLKQNSVGSEDYQTLNITIERSYIKNPVHIGASSKIVNSIIGPYVSIGKHSDIENCIIENSVIEERTHLRDIISKDSIIGSNVKVSNICKNNLIIGDKSVY